MTDDNKDDFTINVFWSFRSPYCYFTLDRLLEMERQFDLFINVRPIYPMAVRAPKFFKDVNPKYRRYHTADCLRVADYLGMPYRRAVPDPIVQNLDTGEIADEQPYITTVTRLCAAAQIRKASLPFVDKVMRIIWDGTVDNWHEGSHILDAINAAGLNGHALFADTEADPERLEAVIAENQTLHDQSDHWGVPLITFRGETFYGQDRLDILLWRMLQAGLPTRG